MVWDGTRWVSETPTPAPGKPSALRTWLATGVMILVIAAIVVPFAVADAGAARLTASPSSGKSGDRISIAARRLPPRSTIQLTWDGSTTGMPKVQATPGGRIDLQWTVPGRAGGTTHPRRDARRRSTGVRRRPRRDPRRQQRAAVDRRHDDLLGRQRRGRARCPGRHRQRSLRARRPSPRRRNRPGPPYPPPGGPTPVATGAPRRRRRAPPPRCPIHRSAPQARRPRHRRLRRRRPDPTAKPTAAPTPDADAEADTEADTDPRACGLGRGVHRRFVG